MATEAIDLDKDAFMRLVTQEHLDVKGPSAGYLYAGKQGKTGWEVYKCLCSVMWDELPISYAATADPAAGANPAVMTVPAGKRWLWLAGSCSLTTDATVIDRYPLLVVKQLAAGNVEERYMSPTPITASLTVISTFAGGAAAAAIVANGQCNVPIPAGGIEIKAGGTVQVTFLSIQAADNAGAVFYKYKEAEA